MSKPRESHLGLGNPHRGYRRLCLKRYMGFCPGSAHRRHHSHPDLDSLRLTAQSPLRERLKSCRHPTCSPPLINMLPQVLEKLAPRDSWEKIDLLNGGYYPAINGCLCSRRDCTSWMVYMRRTRPVWSLLACGLARQTFN